MTRFIETINGVIAKRRAYNRVVAELSRMSIDTALDLDIYHGDIPAIARNAVYGK